MVPLKCSLASVDSSTYDADTSRPASPESEASQPFSKAFLPHFKRERLDGQLGSRFMSVQPASVLVDVCREQRTRRRHHSAAGARRHASLDLSSIRRTREALNRREDHSGGDGPSRSSTRKKQSSFFVEESRLQQTARGKSSQGLSWKSETPMDVDCHDDDTSAQSDDDFPMGTSPDCSISFHSQSQSNCLSCKPLTSIKREEQERQPVGRKEHALRNASLEDILTALSSKVSAPSPEPQSLARAVAEKTSMNENYLHTLIAACVSRSSRRPALLGFSSKQSFSPSPLRCNCPEVSR